MGVSLGKEFHAACGGELLEEVYELGHILLALFECHSGDGEGAAEFRVLFEHAQQALCGRNIAALGYACHNVIVGEVIVIVMVVTYVEETVSFKAKRLVNLEIKTNSFHDRGCVIM